MARSFYADSKRVSNARLKQELGVRLSYPTYREGLDAPSRASAQTRDAVGALGEAQHGFAQQRQVARASTGGDRRP